MLTIVTGAPGSGKTTWVENQRQPGDLVFDMDAVAAALFGMPKYPRPTNVNACMKGLRLWLLEWMQRTKFNGRAFVIVTSLAHARTIARLNGARLVMIDEKHQATQMNSNV